MESCHSEFGMLPVVLPAVLPAAGMAGMSLVIAMTSRFTAYIRATRTAEGRTAALRELLTEVEKEHTNLTKNLLPKLPPEEIPNEEEFRNLRRRTFLLNSLSSRLSALEKTISSSGMWRLSSTYMQEEICVISVDLEELNKNTASTTIAVNKVIADLLKKGNVQFMYGDDTETLVQLNAAPATVAPDNNAGHI